jgi:hypothetical protein
VVSIVSIVALSLAEPRRDSAQRQSENIEQDSFNQRLKMTICSRSPRNGPWRAFAIFGTRGDRPSPPRAPGVNYGRRNDSAGPSVDGQEEKRFSRSIRILIAELGRVRYVSDVHEALDCLMYGWPTEHNSQYARAIETCLNVIAKRGHVNEAEAAFSDAADEAGLLLRGPGPH